MSEFDVVIIGSGPAGVSAAFPLVEAGRRVLMLDPGDERPPPLPDEPYRDFRKTAKDQWQFFLGRHFEALAQESPASPKFRVPSLAYVFAEHAPLLRAHQENFTLYHATASGGLSNAWGAGVAEFDAEDLRDFPFVPHALRPSYDTVAKRIGISGVSDDALADFFGTSMPIQAPPLLAPPAQALLSAFNRLKQDNGFRLGRARNAVITADEENRKHCDARAMCLWGCARGAIYSAAHDLQRLKRYPNFTHLPGVWIETVAGGDGQGLARGYYLEGRRPFEIRASRILLACGAVASGKLVLQALRTFNKPIRLLSNPSAGFAVWLPRLLGEATPDMAFGLSQLSFVLAAAEKDDAYVFGNLFAAAGLPVEEFIRRAPLPRRLARQLLRLLLPSMLVGNCFLSGTVTRHSMQLKEDKTLHIRGDTAPEFAQVLGTLRRRLTRAFARYGARLVPGSFSLAPLGSDVHYAGTVPMRTKPLPGECGADGAVAGLPNIYVVDGAALPSLPAKAHTLTIMANADRIVRQLLN